MQFLTNPRGGNSIMRPTADDPPEKMLDFAVLCTLLLVISEADHAARGGSIDVHGMATQAYEWADTLAAACEAFERRWGPS